MKTKNPIFLLLISVILIGMKPTSAQNSKYFPDNCWGVYSWSGWDTEKVTPQTHPLIKGAPIILKWKDLEPEPGKFMFDKLIGEKLELADEFNFYTFLMIWVAPNAPRWLYENGVPELEMTKTIDPFGRPRDWTFQYYLDEDYIQYYYRLLSEFGKYLQSLPQNLRDRLIFVQSAEGSTGDGGPYKGDPLDLKYDITREQWTDFRINAWEVLKEALSNEKDELITPILVNYDSNGKKEYNWLINNLPVIGLKNGMFSHGYHISNTKTRIKNWENFKQQTTEKGIEFFSRGEQDGEWAIYGWSTKNTEQAFYWSSLFATHCSIDMWNVPASASDGYKHQDAINFFNKYAGQHDPSTASAAFCALRKGLDAADTISYSEDIYGKCLRSNIDRYLTIAESFSQYGAYQGDPEKAIGGGMLNRKRQNYNDVGWEIHDGNYQRYIKQINPEETSQGWWHIGPVKSIYSRFARSIKIKDGAGALYFDINDQFTKEHQSFEIRIVWLDQEYGEWTMYYDSKGEKNKNVLSVKNRNTGKWMEKTVLIKDAEFENKGENSSDIFIKTKSEDTTIIHMLEVTKK